MHTNVDALSRNPVGEAVDDDDFNEKIQDIGNKQDDAIETTGGIFSVRYGEELEWFGLRRQSGGLTEHHRCYFGINHLHWSKGHQLFMLNVLAETSQDQEDNSPMEDMEAADSEEVRNSGSPNGKRVLKEGRVSYYNRQQQLELVLAAQELLEYGECEEARSGGEETGAEDASNTDIWEDEVCLGLLKKGVIPDTTDLQASKRARKRATHYCWKDEKFYFKGLYVPKPEERMELVNQMHEDLGHFGEQRTLVEICRRYFWNNRTECVKIVIKMCQQCQMVKSVGSIRSGDEQLKSIPICDLFHKVTLDTVGPLPETKSGNKYIMVAIDHYSKWCKAKAVANHGAKTATKFLEDEVICRYGVPKFVLTDNGGEWATEFDVMCKDYAI
jgi:hypothetical protein